MPKVFPPDQWFRDIESYLENDERFVSDILHDHGQPQENVAEGFSLRQQGLDRWEQAQFGAWQALWKPGKSKWDRPSLKILIVDNEEWNSIKKLASGEPGQDLKPGWAAFVDTPGIELLYCEYKKEECGPDLKWKCRPIDKKGNIGTKETALDVPWPKLDLILQDIFLVEKGALGYEFSEKYLECAPQAFVFLLTSMELEALAGSGVTHHAERTLSKRRVQGVLWEYYRCFREFYGELLWPVWAAARSGKGLTSRQNLRKLFGSLRRWRHEPGILFHGHLLPELVEHAYAHTSSVWKLAQDVLVPLYGADLDKLPAVSRVLLCLGIWLHDVGHMGDEHFAHDDQIRRFHGSISDHHLLRNPYALGLDWLMKLCDKGCQDKDPKRFTELFSAHQSSTNATALERLSTAQQKRLNCANERKGCVDGGAVCPMRAAGILARYHQRSAPMFDKGVEEILKRNAQVSPYCLVPLDIEGNTLEERSGASYEAAATWLDSQHQLDWPSFTVRLLTDFQRPQGADLVWLEQLLRWIDMLQFHRCRVGSPVKLATVMNYASFRVQHVDKRIAELEAQIAQYGTVDATVAGLWNEHDQLSDYRRYYLLYQDFHYWLHACVKDISFVNDPKNPFVRFELDRVALLNVGAEFKKHAGAGGKSADDDARALAAHWAKVFAHDFIVPELKAQSQTQEGLASPLDAPLGVTIEYKYSIEGQPEEHALPVPRPDKAPHRAPPSAYPFAKCFPDLRKPEKREAAGSLLLDCDPGVDDLLALAVGTRFFADLNVIATAGNVGLVRTLANARLSIAFLHEAYPERTFNLYRGASRSLAGDSPAAMSVHGRDGLGEVPLLEPWRPLTPMLPVSDMGASKAYEEFAKPNGTGPKTCVITGPMTNLAMALLQSPDPDALIRGLGRVFVMGGSFHDNGNISPAAEFNVFFDPLALEVVLRFYAEFRVRLAKERSDKTPPQTDSSERFGLFFCPLDVTDYVQLFDDWVAPRADNKLSAWSHLALQKYMHFHVSAARSLDRSKLKNARGKVKSLYKRLISQAKYQSIVAHTARAKKFGGKHSEKIEKFGQMHDPLTVWVAARCLVDPKRDLAWFDKCNIAVAGRESPFRGSLQVVKSGESGKRPRQGERKEDPGTTVHFLAPWKFPVAEYGRFIQDLAAACNWDLK